MRSSWQERLGKILLAKMLGKSVAAASSSTRSSLNDNVLWVDIAAVCSVDSD
jgi:hypothetical protein